MYEIKDIAILLDSDSEIVGTERQFANLKPVTEALHDSLTFISSNKKNKQAILDKTKAAVVICDKSMKNFNPRNRCLILVSDPQLTMTKIGNHLFTSTFESGIHPTAVIHPEAILHKEIKIGPNVVIGKCTIGKRTEIFGNTFIYDNVTIGDNVRIFPGCTIGAEGFGYIKTNTDEYENFPHIGGVVIHNNVDIGANCCIDRGALGPTIIGEGTKIDNLVHIAHNVRIGKYCLITAQVVFSGSTVVEDHSYIAPGALFVEGLRIGEHSKIGIGAVVLKNVPPRETWTGYPAMELTRFAELQYKLKKK